MRRAIKILYFHTSLANKGPTKQLLYLVKLMQKDAVVTVLTLFSEGKSSLAHCFSSNSLSVVTPKGSSALHLIKVLSVLKSADYDVLHTAGFLPDLFAYLFCPRTKWVSVARNYPPDDYPKKFGSGMGRALANVQLFLHSKCKNQVACSAALCAQLNVRNINARVIRNAVSVVDQPTPKEKLRRPLRYLILGAMSQRKRVGLAIDLYLQLRQSGDRLAVVGDGPLKDDLTAKHRGSPDITFTGHVQDVKNQLAVADVLISMSSSEGFPNAVLEALTSGLFCVLSNIQPHLEFRRLLEIGVATISATEEATFSRENSEIRALTQTVCQLPDDLPRRVAEQAKTIFSTEVMVKHYMDLYEDISCQKH